MVPRFDHVLNEVDCYLHGVLSPKEGAYLEQHCQACPVCKTALEEAEKRFAVVQSVPPSEASSALIQATIHAIERYSSHEDRRRKRLRRYCLPLVAAVVLMFTCLYGAYWTVSPSPYDLRILGQTRLHAGADIVMRVWVVEHEKGSGLPKVPVDIELNNPEAKQSIQLAHFITDDQGVGQPHFRVPDWKDGTYDIHVTARPGGHTQSIVRSVQLAHSWKIMVTSDRPIYQPGDTIHVRGLALHSLDLKPVVGQTAIFSISDPRGNIVFKQKQVTSRFGIGAADCPLAREIREGTYTIECQLGEIRSKLAVEVKKYVLPKFKVEVTADKSFYFPGQRIGGTVKASYFFGKPVSDAGVLLALRGTQGKVGMEEVLTLHTNAEGDVSFVFPQLPTTILGEDESERSLDLVVTVTDSAGQKQTRTVPILVTGQPLRIDVIPEAGTLVANLPNRVYFYVHRADGLPVRARINISGPDKEITTNDLGVASYEVNPTDELVVWTVRASDDEGHEAIRKVTLEPGKATDDFLFRTDHAVYAGGDTINLSASGGREGTSIR